MPRVGRGKKPVTVILPDETFKLLKYWAELKDWSISQAAKNLIERGLDNEPEAKAQSSQPE